MRSVELRVEDPLQAGQRLDSFVAERLGLLTRSQLKARLASITVNGESARPSRRLRLGDLVRAELEEPPPLLLAPEPMRLAVLFENADVIVVDKPQAMVVHPGSGNRTGTLLNGLLAHCAGLAEAFGPGEARPGIVHRLDKDTSGVIIAAKNPRAHAELARQFKDRAARKRYLAIVRGGPPADRGTIEARLARSRRDRQSFRAVEAGGRAAVTRYRVLRRWPGYSLVLLAPLTGRTHQLRVHLRLVGCPILGDPRYGGKDARFAGATLMLHAWRLSLRLPGESAAREFRAPLPQRFREVVRQLRASPPARG